MNLNCGYGYACYMLKAYIIYLFVLTVGWYIIILTSK
jgi:hypothetical protein